jgi:hypothetical protein
MPTLNDCGRGTHNRGSRQPCGELKWGSSVSVRYQANNPCLLRPLQSNVGLSGEGRKSPPHRKSRSCHPIAVLATESPRVRHVDLMTSLDRACGRQFGYAAETGVVDDEFVILLQGSVNTTRRSYHLACRCFNLKHYSIYQHATSLMRSFHDRRLD